MCYCGNDWFLFTSILSYYLLFWVYLCIIILNYEASIIVCVFIDLRLNIMLTVRLPGEEEDLNPYPHCVHCVGADYGQPSAQPWNSIAYVAIVVKSVVITCNGQ